MADEKKIKSLFEMAKDLVTNKDEKAAAEAKAAAEKEAAELESRRKAAEAAQERLRAQAETQRQAAEAAEKAAREKQLAEENKARAAAMAAQAAAAAKAAEDAKAAAAAAAEAARPKFIGEYEVKPDDTLSAIALKFYKHATPPYYTLIYEANKDVIGSNMNIIRPGTKLHIPELPDALK